MKTKARKAGAHQVTFGTPPPQRRDYHWAEVAEQLQAHPGEWALVHKDLPSSVVWAINAGRVAPVSPTLGFTTRTVGNHVGDDGKRWCRELWMVHEAPASTSKTKQNGAVKK